MSMQSVKTVFQDEIAEELTAEAKSNMFIAPQWRDPVRRHEMIARNAFKRAEKRGFRGGDPVADWLEAEAEVDHILNMNV